MYAPSLTRRTVGLTATKLVQANRVWSCGAARASSSSSAVADEDAGAQATSRRRRREVEDTGDVDLVGPPDPLSNIRPVIYASSRRRQPSNSPYSSAEFPSENLTRTDELELAYNMHRDKINVTNHRFWATTNAMFEAQREARLAQLPPASDPPTAEDEAAREAVISQFYRDFQIANRQRMNAWVKEWWRDVWTGLKLQAKIYTRRALRL